jgi:peptide-methionine (S)-S-oxide reductase
MEQATFGAGCFWGVESAFREIPGVTDVAVGFMGGRTVNPTYREVCEGNTNHAEVAQVTFDPSKVSYVKLLDAFWRMHDPTTLNRQGPDVGSQYRSVIFTHSPEQAAQATISRDALAASGRAGRKIVTQIVPATEFYPAEEYHQRYFEKQGIGASCHRPV